MAKKVKYTDIAEPNLFEPGIKSAEDFIKVLDNLEKQFGDILKASAKTTEGLDFSKISAKQLREVEEAIKKGKAAQEGLNETLTERERLEKRLAALIEQRGSEEDQLKEAIKAQRKENREAAKDAVGLTDEYKKLSKQLVANRREWKNLAAQNKENTEEAKELLKEVQKLDKRLKEIDDTVGQNGRSVGSYVRALDSLKGRFKALQGLAIVGVLTNIAQLFQQNEEGGLAFSKILNEVTVRTSLFVNVVTKASGSGGGLAGSIKAMQEELKTFNERAELAVKRANELAEAQLKVARENAALSASVADARVSLEKFRFASEDNTRSLDSQEKNLTRYQNKLTQVNEDEEKIARNNLAIATQRRKSAEETGIGVTAAIEAEAAAQVALTETLLQNEQERLEIDRRRREIELDKKELELDILIDGVDARKTANERIIADETVANEKRREILERTTADLDNSFARQIAIFEEATGKRIDGQKLLQTLDEQGVEALNKQVEALGLTERMQTRLLESIRDRVAAEEDLREANRDLTESDRNLADGTRLLAAQQRVLDVQLGRRREFTKQLRELEEEQLQIELEGLEKRLQQIDAKSPEFIAAQNRISEIRIEQRKKAQDEELKLQQQFQEASLALLQGFLDKQSEARLESIDKQIKASTDRESQLREAAKQGSEDALDNLAFEQKKRAELERERERQVQRQARLELILATFQTFQSKVASGEPNPLVSTITDVELLRQFVNALPAFWEGAEHIGDALGAPQLAGKDGHIVRVDGSERVVPGHINQRLKGISNAELATLADLSRLEPLRVRQDGEPVVLALEKVRQTIAGKPVYLGQDYDAKRKQTIDLIQRQNRLERRRRKSGGPWG